MCLPGIGKPFGWRGSAKCTRIFVQKLFWGFLDYLVTAKWGVAFCLLACIELTSWLDYMEALCHAGDGSTSSQECVCMATAVGPGEQMCQWERC